MRTLFVLLFVIGLAVRAIPQSMPYFIALAVAALVAGLHRTGMHLEARARMRLLEYRIVAVQQFLATRNTLPLTTEMRRDLLSYTLLSIQWLRRAESCLRERNYAVAIQNAISGLDGCRSGQRVMHYFETSELLADTIAIPVPQERLPIIANGLFAVVFGACFLFPSLLLILSAMALVFFYIFFRMVTTYNRRRGELAIHCLQREINATMESVLAAKQLDTVAGSHLLGAIALATKARDGYLGRKFAYLWNKTYQAFGKVEAAKQQLAVQLATAR